MAVRQQRWAGRALQHPVGLYLQVEADDRELVHATARESGQYAAEYVMGLVRDDARRRARRRALRAVVDAAEPGEDGAA